MPPFPWMTCVLLSLFSEYESPVLRATASGVGVAPTCVPPSCHLSLPTPSALEVESVSKCMKKGLARGEWLLPACNGAAGFLALCGFCVLEFGGRDEVSYLPLGSSIQAYKLCG